MTLILYILKEIIFTKAKKTCNETRDNRIIACVCVGCYIYKLLVSWMTIKKIFEGYEAKVTM